MSQFEDDVRRSSHEGVPQQLSISSEDTEFNMFTGPGASALEHLTNDNTAPHVEAPASCPLGSIANPFASSSHLLAATALEPPLAPAPAPGPVPSPVPAPALASTQRESAVSHDAGFDASTCVEAVLHDVQRGKGRKYMLTLKPTGSEKQLCMRIGDTEGSSIAIAAALMKETMSR